MGHLILDIRSTIDLNHPIYKEEGFFLLEGMKPSLLRICSSSQLHHSVVVCVGLNVAFECMLMHIDVGIHL